jgi:dGTPase
MQKLLYNTNVNPTASFNSASFSSVAATPSNPEWPRLIARLSPLYQRVGDPRGDFSRDYSRILHCTAYRRLKHKTQVFYATENDHICTRIEHVNHVVDISRTMSLAMGLNVDLTNAIAIGHDVGHAPFGHEGETVLTEIAAKYGVARFWHEKNSLWFLDRIETLPDPASLSQNMSLTYAVRDGIICHCGEIDQPSIFPRIEFFDLESIQKAGQFQPVTWEGCIVKIADKIAFLGRDIEDAFTLSIMDRVEFAENAKALAPNLPLLFKKYVAVDLKDISNTALIQCFIGNILNSSDPINGIIFSPDLLELIKGLRQISRKLIYDHPRLKYFKKLAKLVLESIYEELDSLYAGKDTLANLRRLEVYAPILHRDFEDWVIKYTNVDEGERINRRYASNVVYDIGQINDYRKTITDFLSGMTDNYALAAFDNLTKFR